MGCRDRRIARDGPRWDAAIGALPAMGPVGAQQLQPSIAPASFNKPRLSIGVWSIYAGNCCAPTCIVIAVGTIGRERIVCAVGTIGRERIVCAVGTIGRIRIAFAVGDRARAHRVCGGNDRARTYRECGMAECRTY